MMKRYCFYLPLFLILSFQSIFAQTSGDSTQLWRIETVDGNEFIGPILSRTAADVEIKTQSLGILTIPVKSIVRIEALRDAKQVNGDIWPENHQSTRYFWSPNGFGLKKGEAYYQNNWVLLNQVSVGITDQISVGVGMIPLFLFAGTPTPVWATPKVSIPVKKDKFCMGVGALVGGVIGEESFGFGITYGVATVGNRDKNLTFGMGYGYADGGWANSPTITLSGMLRIGKKAYLVTENYYFGEDATIISFGGRSVWSKVSLDYGVVLPIIEEFIGIPWLGISLPLKSKKSKLIGK